MIPGYNCSTATLDPPNYDLFYDERTGYVEITISYTGTETTADPWNGYDDCYYTHSYYLEKKEPEEPRIDYWWVWITPIVILSNFTEKVYVRIQWRLTVIMPRAPPLL